MTVDDLLRRTLDQSDEHALVLLDANGVVVGWFMGAERIFGRTAADMLGRTIDCLFTPEDQVAGLPETERRTAARSPKAEDDRWMMRSDGFRFFATGIMHGLRGADGEIVGFAKILRDRTDLRGQIEILRNRADLLAAEDRRKLLTFGALAHEIRTPLSALANAVHIIEASCPANERVTFALQILKRQTSYVTSILEGLLEAVRARAGKATLDIRRVDLAEVVDEAAQTVGAQFEQRRQHLEVIKQPGPIVLDGDPVRLKQVLVNLLTNASKFSPAGASVWMKTWVEADEAIVRVEDRGRGIPAALLPRVFELLSQAEGPRTEESGLGLGLSIVKDYVELHGGVVQVRSEGIGRGSEFTVRLPLQRAAASPAPADVSIPGFDAQS